jgi:hypothetical protein
VARSVSPTGVGGLDTGSKQISKHVDKNACRGVVKTRVLTHVSSCVNTCLSGQSPPRSCIVKPLNPTPPPTSNWVIRGQVCVCAELVVLRVCWAQNRYPKRCHGSATVTRANSTFAEVMVSISVRSLYTIPEHCLVRRTARRRLQVSRDHCIHTSHTLAVVGSGRLWPSRAGLGRLWRAVVGSGRLWPSRAGLGRLWRAVVGSGRLWPSRAGREWL